MRKAPIPGQSLTTAPRSMPYERPPAINDPEEALQMHLSRLTEPEKQEAILDALELDVDIATLTEGILRAGVAGGHHSIDTSQIIAPIIHRFIKKLADSEGVEYDEGLEDKEEQEERRKAIDLAKAYKKVNKMFGTPEEEAKEEPEPTPEPEPEGLIARRNKQ